MTGYFDPDAPSDGDGVELPPVAVAWGRVMADVQAVAKGDRNESQGFNFRGIDAVRNAVGPALRAHGVFVIPERVEADYQSYATRGGTQMRGCTMKVRYRIYGPRGDSIDGEMIGESADAGDKATSKAASVTARSFLLDALCIPTSEPDPDADSHERVAPEAPPPPAAASKFARRFDPARFVAACERTQLEPGAVIERAGLTIGDHDPPVYKTVDQLKGSDRPKLFAALAALADERRTAAQGGTGDGSGAGFPRDVLPPPPPAPDPDPPTGEAAP